MATRLGARLVGGFQRCASLLSLGGAYAAAVSILLIAAFILLEIVLRTFFASSTFIMDEMVGYLVAAAGFLALGYTLDQGALLRVNLLLDSLRDMPRLRILVEAVCVILTLAVTGLLIWYFFINVERQFSRGYTSGTMSGMPQWIPTGAMLAGLVIFWLQVLAYGLGLAGGHIIAEEIDETAIG